MITFVHTADIHFGMENYGRVDQKTGIHTRLLDFERALSHCIDVAIERKVDFFLFCGDAYKTTNPSPTQQKLMMGCLLRLYQAQIPIIIIVGNHDNPLSFGKSHALELFADLPVGGFHVISKPKTIRLETKNGPINIVGIPWPTRNSLAISFKHNFKDANQLTDYIASGVSQIIADMAAELDPDIPAVLAGHLTVSSGVFSGSERRAIYGTDPVILPSQLAIKPFDYVALGHLHRHQNLNSNGYPSVIYSGSIERIDFGERKEEKGFCLVSIPKKNKASYTFIKTPIRPFHQIEVKLSGEENQTQQILAKIKKYDVKDAVLKIVYHVPADAQDTVSLNAIEHACRDAIYVVGVFPVHIPKTRTKRSSLKVDMSLQTLLASYFEQHAEWKDKKDELIKKALFMEQEIETEISS